MTYEDFLKAFIEENKSKISRNGIFGGYDFLKYDYDNLVDKSYEFMIDKGDKLLYLPKPLSTEVYFGQHD